MRDDMALDLNEALSARARELGHTTMFSATEIHQAVYMVNLVRHRHHRLEFPRHLWLEILEPGCQLSATMGRPLEECYYEIIEAVWDWRRS